MKQRKFWQRYRRQMSIGQRKKSIKVGLLHIWRRDRLALAPIFIEPKLTLKSVPRFISETDEVTGSNYMGMQPLRTLLLSASSGIRHWLIVGAPGSGKTTLLHHAASLLASKHDIHQRGTPKLLPVFLSLPAYASLVESLNDFSLVDAICEQMQEWWHQTVPRPWVEEVVAAAQCVILLDGLDAVADQHTRKQMTTWVQQQMSLYRRNRFFVTLRSLEGYETLVDQAGVVEICPFSMEQIEQYTQQWFHVNVAGHSWGKEPLRASRQGRMQGLLEQLRATPSLRAFASNPLHLLLLLSVYQYRQVLPAQWEQLAMEILYVLQDQLQGLSGTWECSVTQLQKVLGLLAWSALEAGKREISAGEAQHLLAQYSAQDSLFPHAGTFLDLISACGAVLLWCEGQRYRFTHRAVQEYFAAWYAREHGLEQVLANEIGNSWWHETIRFFCTQADAHSLLQSCLDYPGTPASVLALIGHCLEHHRSVLEPTLHARCERLIEEHLDAPDPAKRQTAAEIWLRKRLHAMIALRDGSYRDSSLLTCTEYQLFLEAQRLYGRFFQPDHWESISVPEGQGRGVVLGVRASDARAFCRWLTEQDQEGWQYRLPNADEWNEPADREACLGTPVLPGGSGCWIDMESGATWKGSLPPMLARMDSTMQELVARDWSRHSADLAGFARPLGLAHQLTRLLACDLERDLVPHLLLARERLTGCDLEQSFALAHTLAAVLERLQVLALAHTSDLHRALVGDLSGTTTAGERTKIFTHVRDLAGLLVSASDLSHHLLALLERALERGGRSNTLAMRKAEDNLHSDDGRIRLMAALRSCTLHMACFLSKLGQFLFSVDVTRWFQHYLWGKDYADLDSAAFEQAIAGYLDLYLTLLILELRRQGQVPAWEGILLIKERTSGAGSYLD